MRTTALRARIYVATVAEPVKDMEFRLDRQLLTEQTLTMGIHAPVPKVLGSICLAGIVALGAASFWIGYRCGSRSVRPARSVAQPESNGSLVTGVSRDTVLQMLPGKIWYWHWEKRDREHPSEFTRDDHGEIFTHNGAKNWKVELRWILNEGDHLFIPTDEHTLRGFYIPTGRQAGLFSDPTQ